MQNQQQHHVQNQQKSQISAEMYKDVMTFDFIYENLTIYEKDTVKVCKEIIDMLQTEPINTKKLFYSKNFFDILKLIPSMRPLCWRLMLNYLPEQRKRWVNILETNQKNYEKLKDEFMAPIKKQFSKNNNNNNQNKFGENIQENQKKAKKVDHPLSKQKDSKWNSYFSDNKIYQTILKDTKRTRTQENFFGMKEKEYLQSLYEQDEEDENLLGESFNTTFQKKAQIRKRDFFKKIFKLQMNSQKDKEPIYEDEEEVDQENIKFEKNLKDENQKLQKNIQQDLQKQNNNNTSNTNNHNNNNDQELQENFNKNVNLKYDNLMSRQNIKEQQKQQQQQKQSQSQEDQEKLQKNQNQKDEEDEDIYYYEIITRILFIYVKLNPQIGYTQGMNEICAVIYYCFFHDTSKLLRHFAESDTFYCFCILMTSIKHNFQQDDDEFYNEDFCENGSEKQQKQQQSQSQAQSQNKIQKNNNFKFMNTSIRSNINKFQDNFQKCDHILYSHLNKNQVDPKLYLVKWMIVLLAQDFEIEKVLRIWDAMMIAPDKMGYLIYVCIGILNIQRDQLLEKDFSGILMQLQNIGHLKTEEILQRSFTMYKTYFCNNDIISYFQVNSFEDQLKSKRNNNNLVQSMQQQSQTQNDHSQKK